MQEDKNLKALLQQWATEKPSADFANGVMQRISASHNLNSAASGLLKPTLPRALCVAFVLACIALFALSFTVHNMALPSLFTISLPAKYLSQGFSFLLVFWVVMLFNIIQNKYSTKLS